MSKVLPPDRQATALLSRPQPEHLRLLVTQLFKPHLLAFSARRLVGARVDLAELARDWTTVHPAEVLEAEPMICLPGQLDKVTGTPRDTSVAFELTKVRGGPIGHAATRTCILDDVLIEGGCLYVGGRRRREVPRRVTPAEGEVVQELPHAVLTSTFYGNLYFGHWMADVQPRILLARTLGEPISIPGPDWPHLAPYRALFGTQTRAIRCGRIRQLTLLEDFGQNSHRRARYLALRERLQPLGQPKPSPGVMLLRGRQGQVRELVNEMDLAERLAKERGFDIVDPAQCRAEDIVRRLVGTRYVVGVEGSQLAHATFSLSQHGALIALQPPWRFNNSHKDRMDCIGIRYGSVVGDAVTGGFRIDPDDLMRTLDLADRALA